MENYKTSEILFSKLYIHLKCVEQSVGEWIHLEIGQRLSGNFLLLEGAQHSTAVAFALCNPAAPGLILDSRHILGKS